MPNEIEKTVLVGTTGNTATVTEETRSTRSLEAQHGQRLMAQAGELYCPLGFRYLGSAAVHYYSKEIDGGENPSFVHVCQTNVSKVNENHADLGWKALQAALMRSYGRAEPRKVRNES